MVLNKEKIKERILELVELYETDKAFVEACGITNMAFVTNIKKGKNSNPGALYIAQIVRGTGVNPYWLLLGEGEMFEDRKGSYTDTKGVDDTDLVRGLELIQRIERKTSEATGRTIPKDIQKKIDQLLLSILQRRLGE
ncbi:MAG: hypothetical protein GVY20_02075 [Bacteroidetes bacterium]|jgi:hypothetical protein|nr:hypothetical protein [Bacteroidota bacterium]